MDTIRVGTDEVYITPEGKIQTAFMAVVWAVNARCKERGIEPLFGEPLKIDSNDWGGAFTREVYVDADIIHVNGARAQQLDPTVRIVPKTPLAVELFDEVWPAIRERTALIQYAHNIPGSDRAQLADWQRQHRLNDAR